ncbi:SDR family NAD(P)-dependent oxidoreductase [Nocardioides sp.]|uniref:SDR family NAD(P)-dependent oxidoreductase n=1 Tax=Nocardioides sp. TaxID=35761 RepID=UPI00271ED752|nr:SDR family oxidoreductase [Nocardioides sp.]MDO9457635.1 SDR family oxidoreductase [Nocardioides sp.]
MDLQLTGKRALVIGGTKGIGLAVARALALEGAVVVVASRSGGEDVAAALSAETGAQVVGRVVDNRDDASVLALVDGVVAELGGVDVLVNTAAAAWTAEMNTVASETSDDAMREQFEAKPLAYLRAARAVAPHMKAAGWGRIVNVSGLGARSAGSVAQTVRNVAVSAITKNLADELGPFGINVTVVHPGLTRTERLTTRLTEQAAAEGTTVEALEKGLTRTSIDRLVDASEVADVVAFLASPRSGAITGDAIAAGGGVPGPVSY